jgi:hypothetical protein
MTATEGPHFGRLKEPANQPNNGLRFPGSHNGDPGHAATPLVGQIAALSRHTVLFGRDSLPTAVNLGSSDSDSFVYDNNTNRMTQYTFSVNGQSVVGNLGSNPSSVPFTVLN